MCGFMEGDALQNFNLIKFKMPDFHPKSSMVTVDIQLEIPRSLISEKNRLIISVFYSNALSCYM